MSFTDSFEDYNLPVFDKGVRLPEIKITEEQKKHVGVKPDCSNVVYLKTLCWNACLEKIKRGEIKQPLKQCKERLQMEFEVFEKTGVIDYLLLLKDIFGWCDDFNVMRGPGRGSAAGSFSLYLIGLTNVNPFEHNLNFTRFLSEARAKPKWIDGVMHVDGKTMADFDGDISFLGRPSVIKRLEKDYAGKTCKISTLQYLTGKMALKDTCKIYLRYNETEAKFISDNIEVLFGKVKSLSDSYEGNPELKKWADSNPRAFSIAKMLEGLIRTSGIHASGMIISYYDILDVMPIQLSDSNEIVSAYDMNTALTIFVKVDLLGLRTLDVIEECCKQAMFSHKDIDINNPVIYNYFASTDNYLGLFQIESGLTKQVVKRVKPKNIDQLAACLSISRPGALKYIDDYVKFVQTGEFKKIYPAIDEILKQTGGLILYQEQINRICQEIYKMSAVNAEEVRRAIGKKSKADMAIWEPALYKHGEENNIPPEITKYFWDTCNASADYLFNANHCYSYSYITAYTTYLKANYLLEFFLALLKLAQHEAKPLLVITAVQKEMASLGLKLYPPNIYTSKDDYSIVKDGILTGLTGVKGISEKALDKLKIFKRENHTKFELFESINTAKLAINSMTALIMSGCLDTFGVTRNKLVLELEVFNLLTERERVLANKFGKEYDWDLCAIVTALNKTHKTDSGIPLIKDGRLETIRNKYEACWQKYYHNTKHEKLSYYIMECEYLGFSYSTTLKDIYSPFCQDLCTVHEAQGELDNTHVRLAVVVEEVDFKISKAKKTPYLYTKVKDETGEITAMIFGQERMDEMKKFNGKGVEVGDILIINGRKNKDVIFLDSVSIQENPVIVKKSELKKLEKVEL